MKNLRHTINYQGMNWIRKEKRLGIYLRDGMCCMYCGAGLEDQITLTLDHLIPWERGGKHDATNLITSCLKCNSVRGMRPFKKFAEHVARYINHGVTAKQIIDGIEKSLARVVDTNRAKEIIAKRPTWMAALKLAAKAVK